MNAPVAACRDWLRSFVTGWDRFWFTPAEPHTLASVRILGGAMLFYTHLVWAFDLAAFLGPHAWIDNATARAMQADRYAWSYLWHVESPSLLWALHVGALVVFALLTLGLWSRCMSVLACVVTLAYCHRLQGALFGLDQINAMLAMYLVVGPCGAAYSLDRWLADRRAARRGTPAAQNTNLVREFLAGTPSGPTIGANVAIRLIQLHMCIIYLFGGISKMKGFMWWDGSATWYALANLEYQSLDMTWLVYYPAFLSLLTHLTVFWETFYCLLIWPKFTRPIMLFLAVCVHGGIALFLGMKTFGLAMLIGNLAFVSPALVRRFVSGAFGLWRGASRVENHSSAPSEGATRRRSRGERSEREEPPGSSPRNQRGTSAVAARSGA